MSQFDIHVACKECDGYGLIEKTKHGDASPWAEIFEQDCGECDGSGLQCLGIEIYDSVADVKEDYPESFIKNMETGEWS